MDSYRSGNHGTVQGKPRWTSGQVDGALYLDGAGTYVELPIGPVVKTLANTPIAAWARWTGSPTDSYWQRIFEFGSSASYMFLSPSGSLGGPTRFVLRTSVGGAEDVINGSIPLNSAWHHVAVVIDSTNSLITLYLDGEVTGSGAMTYNKLNYMGATFYNSLGRSTRNTPMFRGWLDDFYIFDRLLSQQEVLALQPGGGLMRELASRPIPADGTTGVPADTILQWSAGIYA